MNGRFEWLDEITPVSYFGCAALEKPLLVPFFNNAIFLNGGSFLLQTTHNRTLTLTTHLKTHQPAKFPNKLSSTDQ